MTNEPTPQSPDALMLPEDGVLISYSGENADPYEHGLAAFAHTLPETERTGPACSEMIVHYLTRSKPGYTLFILRWPLIAWNLDTNHSTVCRALILVHHNKSGRKDVWSSDNMAMAKNMFEVC